MINTYSIIVGDCGVIRTNNHFILIIKGEMFGKYEATKENFQRLVEILS